MPTKEEVDKLVEDKSSEEQVEKKTVSESDYREAVASDDKTDWKKQYEEHRKLEQKRDQEIHDLREKVKLFESDNSDDKDEDTSDRADSVSKVLTEEDIDKKVNEKIALLGKAQELQANMRAAIEKYGFVDEADTLQFIKDKGGKLTLQEAITLKYPSELQAFNNAHSTEEVAETDGGGRTILTKPAQSDDHGELKQGFRTSQNDDNGFYRHISKSLTQNIKKATGQR